jgi:hypothetical protein
MTNRIDRRWRKRPGPPPRPQDRGVLVTLTSRGGAVADAALDGLLERERELLTGLTPAQRRELAGLLRILLVPFDTAGEPGGAGPTDES